MRISTAVVTVLAAFTSVIQAASLPRSAADVPDTFDYVIVGGGVGGIYNFDILIFFKILTGF
jgi:hypothetical protein